MTNKFIALTASAILSLAFPIAGFAQGAPQTITELKIDTMVLATGYRTSKVVGSSVTNETGDTVGTIDDLIVTPKETVPYAVLSVGGFLGIGTKYVVVPFSNIEVVDKRLVLKGATKKSLENLPAYTYGT